MIMHSLSPCEAQLLKRPLLRHQCNERLSMEAGDLGTKWKKEESPKIADDRGSEGNKKA